MRVYMSVLIYYESRREAQPDQEKQSPTLHG